MKEVLELVYAGNAVGYMLSGKTYSRAIHGHLLVNAALNAILVLKAFANELPSSGALLQPDDDTIQ